MRHLWRVRIWHGSLTLYSGHTPTRKKMIRRFHACQERELLATGSLPAFYKHVNCKLIASQRVVPIYYDNNVLLTDYCGKADAF